MHHSFVVKLATEFLRDELLATGLALEGLNIDNVEGAIVVLDPTKNSVLIRFVFFFYKLLYFCLK